MDQLVVDRGVEVHRNKDLSLVPRLQDGITSFGRRDDEEITKYKRTVNIIHRGSGVKQEIIWDTGIDVGEYEKLEKNNTLKGFEVVVFPEIYFLRKSIKFPEESCFKSLDSRLEQLNLFEFIQFCLSVKRLNRRLLGSRVYVPIGLTVGIKTNGPNGVSFEDISLYPIYEDKGLLGAIAGGESSLRGASSPTIKFPIESKFFLAKVV